MEFVKYRPRSENVMINWTERMCYCHNYYGAHLENVICKKMFSQIKKDHIDSAFHFNLKS